MNADHERQTLLRGRLAAWREEGIISRDAEEAAAATIEVPWRTHGILAQIVFFLLTAIGLAAFYGLLYLIDLEQPGIATGLAALAVAEYLIRMRRWFGTGVEGALWLGALLAFISELPSRGTPESLLVIALAPALAGFRVRNPLFGAAAAVLVVMYTEERFDLGVVAALIIATAALLMILREWRRPSTEWLWIAIALIAPLAGWTTADEVWRNVTIILYAAFGALAMFLAITKRHHAFFAAAAIGLAIASIDFARDLDVALEAKLAFAGALLLLASGIVSRALRDRAHGITAKPVRLPIDLDIPAAVAGSHVIPQPEAPPETRPQGGGGFGGAGATGEF